MMARNSSVYGADLERRRGSAIVRSLPLAVSFCLLGQVAAAVFSSVQAAEPDSTHQGRYVQRGPFTPLKKAPVSPDSPVSSDSPLNGDAPVSSDTAVSSDGSVVPSSGVSGSGVSGSGVSGGGVSDSYGGSAPDASGGGAEAPAGAEPSVEAPAADGSGGEGEKARAVNDVSPAEKARLEREKAAQIMADALHNEAIDHYELARAYLSQWNTEMAEMELKASIMCEPGMKAAHRDYVIVSLLRFNPLKALAEMMMVVGLGEPVPFSDEQKTKIKDDNAKAHYEKGIALARESKWQEAITEYQWAMTYHPNDARISRSLAFAYGSAGNFEQAEKEYATSFAQDPGDAFTHADLAFLLDKSGDKQKALEQMKTAVELQPKAAALHVDLGWLAEARGDLGLASTEFARAVQLSPRHAALWAHLGKILARQGENVKAREAYEKALALDPKQIDAEQGLQSLNPIGSPEGSRQGLPHGVAPGASPAAPAPSAVSEIKKAG